MCHIGLYSKYIIYTHVHVYIISFEQTENHADRERQEFARVTHTTLLKQLEASKYLSNILMNADMDTATTLARNKDIKKKPGRLRVIDGDYTQPGSKGDHLTPIQAAGAVAVSHLDTASGELHRFFSG